MRFLRFSAVFLVFALFLVPVSSFADKVTLTAERMDFDTKTGLLTGSGDVVLRREDLKITSDRCEGDYRRNFARMWGNVRIDGKWNGEDLSFSCLELKADFSGPQSVSMAGSVNGRFGQRSLDCYEAEMTGDRFIAAKVRNFSDKAEGFSLSCSSVKGLVDGDDLLEFEAQGGVKIEVTGRRDKKITRISGARAVFAKDRGSIIVSGGAVAIQKGRKVTADNILFYPATNKIEAKGKPSISIEM